MTLKAFFFSTIVTLLLLGCGKSSEVDLPVLEPDYSSNPDLKEILSSEKKETKKVKQQKETSKKKTKKSTTKKPKATNKPLATTKSFTGGKISDGLDMHKIRASANPARTRLVFESYTKTQNNATLSKADNSGNYLFTYDRETLTITALIDGYRAFTALQGAKIATFPAGSMVEKITLLPYMDDSGYKFTIKIKEEAEVKVFELKKPGRIVVDIVKVY